MGDIDIRGLGNDTEEALDVDTAAARVVTRTRATDLVCVTNDVGGRRDAQSGFIVSVTILAGAGELGAVMGGRIRSSTPLYVSQAGRVRLGCLAGNPQTGDVEWLKCPGLVDVAPRCR